MRLTIDNFDVEIKVKAPHDKRFNCETTNQFLNKISLIAAIAEQRYINEGYEKLAAECSRVSDDIFKFLNERNFYDF